MSRQTFLSKDFFVNTSETEAKQRILELPACIGNIKFVAEDTVRHSLRFVYERPADFPENYNYIDVSLLPLGMEQTRVSLHGSYVNGTVFHNDSLITNALYNFESAVHAAVQGSIRDFIPEQLEENKANKQLGVVAIIAAAAGLLYLVSNLIGIV